MFFVVVIPGHHWWQAGV